jgi:hypothetical protein
MGEVVNFTDHSEEDDDKLLYEWDAQDFKYVFDKYTEKFGDDYAWDVIFQLIRLRAGETTELKLNRP